MSPFVSPGLDWHRDLPDFRDYTPEHPLVWQMLGDLKRPGSSRSKLPSRIDLREYFPDVVDQGPLKASTALACVALVEYFQRRAFGDSTRLSALFLYKMARRLSGAGGDTGASLRTTLKALVRFGVPPERYWPYDVTRFDEEPAAFLYSFADVFRSIHYVRLDARNSTGTAALNLVKSFLAAGFPSVFGFPVPSSLTSDPDVPYRPTFDPPQGGLAAVALGYDDRHLRSTKGALLIRTPSGPTWGDNGYAWLPYAYVKEQLAVDFWTLLKNQWLDSGEFHRPAHRDTRTTRSAKQKG